MHEPLDVIAVNEHVTGLPEIGVAVRSTIVPVSTEATENVGVSSAVLLSVLLVPRSEPISRSGVPGAAGLIVMEFVENTERFPAASAV